MPRFLPSLTAALAWGAMFPIAAPALDEIDAFQMTSIRYLAASLVFVALLVAFEGAAPSAAAGAGSSCGCSARSASPASTS